MRVGTKQKKIDVNVPSLEDFVHHVYINAARKIYTNVYLFEMGISSLKSQKNSRELEIIIKECILQTIRETIPVEELLKLYMNETVENAVEVHEREEIISQEPIVDKLVAGNISEPAPMSAKQLSEEAETLSKIKAASSAAIYSEPSVDMGSSSSSASGVSFNMDNNQVIPIENISSENRDDSSKDFDDDYDDEDDDEDDDNIKLSIGDNVELSVDPFPNDDDDNDSNIDLKIEEIPLIDDF
jgi:hypothetical protein